MSFRYKSGDEVEYDNGVISGKGKVVGYSGTPMPFIGASLIIEDMSGNIPNGTYPFSVFIVHEVHIIEELPY